MLRHTIPPSIQTVAMFETTAGSATPFLRMTGEAVLQIAGQGCRAFLTSALG